MHTVRAELRNLLRRGLWVALLISLANWEFAAAAGADRVLLRETTLSIRQVDMDHALSREPNGYVRLDATKLKKDDERIVERAHRAVILENRWVRVTVLPEMGRVYSLVSKVTGHESLWTNAIAKPLAGQVNDLGWWMVWGGVEYTVPRGEHGTTWALPWKYALVETHRRRKSVRMTVDEPATRLRQELEISVEQDRAGYEAGIRVVNTGNEPVRFAHWVNPMWAPGGRGEVTPNTEMIVPCTAMRVADKNFNGWMLGDRVQEFERNPLRWVKHWRDIGDLLCDQLTAGFYSAYSHDAQEGVVRVFPKDITPGMDIWTWGYPVPPSRQKEYSPTPNAGYVEMWGGTVRDFSDDSLATLAPGKEISWRERMYAYHQTGGLTFANEAGAVCFRHDTARNSYEIGLFMTSSRTGAELEIRSGPASIRRRVDLAPNKPYQASIPNASPGPAELIVRHRGRELLRTTAKPVVALEWGGQYLSPAPSEPEKSEISTLLLAQQNAWNRGNIEEFMQGYSHDVTLRFASGATVLQGWEATLKRYQAKYPDRKAMGQLEFSDLDIEILAPDAASVFGKWRLKREKDAPKGLFTLIMRKSAVGWRIVHDHTSAE